jgi:hypothetical protein
LTPAPSGPPLPLEVVNPNSGSYVQHTGPLKLQVNSLRLDVDGRYPQMTASGTRYSVLPLGTVVHWIANLQVGSGAHHLGFIYNSTDSK